MVVMVKLRKNVDLGLIVMSLWSFTEYKVGRFDYFKYYKSMFQTVRGVPFFNIYFTH